MSQPDKERFICANPDREQQRPIALTKLNEWFINQGIPQDIATTSTERINDFYDYLRQQPYFYGAKIGITGKIGEITKRPHAFLCLLFSTPFSIDSLEQTTQFNNLSRHFAHNVNLLQKPSEPSIHLEVFENLDPNVSFNDVLRDLHEADNREYIGILNIEHQPQNKTL